MMSILNYQPARHAKYTAIAARTTSRNATMMIQTVAFNPKGGFVEVIVVIGLLPAAAS